MKYGADPNLADSFDVGLNVPLHKAAELNQIEMCKLLLAAGANPSSQNKTGFSPLHIAARTGRREVIQLLLGFGTTTAPLRC